MLFLVTGGEINVVAIYLSLIPCVIAYNYFFVVEADRVNASIQHLWTIFRPPALQGCSGGVLEGSAHLQPRYP